MGCAANVKDQSQESEGPGPAGARGSSRIKTKRQTLIISSKHHVGLQIIGEGIV
jgi:hypothetical protein